MQGQSLPPHPSQLSATASARRAVQQESHMFLCSNGGCGYGAREAPGITRPVTVVYGQGGTPGGEPPKRRHPTAVELEWPSPAQGPGPHSPLPADVAGDWEEWRESEAYVEWEKEAEEQVETRAERIDERIRQRAVEERPGLPPRRQRG